MSFESGGRVVAAVFIAFVLAGCSVLAPEPRGVARFDSALADSDLKRYGPQTVQLIRR
jgi:hypothetical protein